MSWPLVEAFWYINVPIQKSTFSSGRSLDPNLQYCTGSAFTIAIQNASRRDKSREVTMLVDFMAANGEHTASSSEYRKLCSKSAGQNVG